MLASRCQRHAASRAEKQRYSGILFQKFNAITDRRRVLHNRSAAFEKLPVSATAMKVRKVSGSNIFRYPLLNPQVA
ncbi:hypothetical protein ECE128010_2889 [Escherichia coli E128010]|nr:hypothetical protein ECE128010_2889 [Escherichia coli E128010]CTT93174.1 Uncharacterised protein [Escherichia coli]